MLITQKTREFAEAMVKRMLHHAKRELANTGKVEPVAQVVLRSGRPKYFRTAWNNDEEKYRMLREVEAYIKEKRAVIAFFCSEVWVADIEPDDPLTIPPGARQNRMEGVSCCCQSQDFAFAGVFRYCRDGEIIHLVDEDFEIIGAAINVFGAAFKGGAE